MFWVYKIIRADLNNAMEKRVANINTNTNFNRFKEVKALCGAHSGQRQIRIKDNNGKEITEDKEKANQFKSFYEELYKEMIPKCDSETQVHLVREKLKAVGTKGIFRTINSAGKPSRGKIEFTNFKEVGGWIKKMTNKTSAGDDEIPNIVIRRLPVSYIAALVALLNHCLKNSYFPAQWKTATIIPIPKKGE